MTEIGKSSAVQNVRDEKEKLDAIEGLSTLSISNEDYILSDISYIANKIKHINLDVSSVKAGLSRAIRESPKHESGRTSITQCAPFQSLLPRLLKVEPFGSQEFIFHCLQNRQRLHADLLKKASDQALRTAQTTSQDRLPVELWAQIFHLCLPNDDFVRPDPRQAPLLLCQICSIWRAIATNTPLLWSTLSIRGSWRRYIGKPFLECWLNRSRNALLYFEVSIPASMETPFKPDAMDFIVSSAHRWRHLRLNVPDNLLWLMLNNIMPVLHRLELSSIYPIATLSIQASQAPNLKVVSLLTKPLYPQPLSLPWQYLESFSSQCWLNMGQHIEILRMCPRLQFYSMCLVHADIPSDAKPSPLVMYHLRHLKIIAFVGNAMGPILGLLQLPKLTHMSFIVPNESPVCGIADWPKLEVISLVERSLCVLTKVCLQGVDMSKDSIQDMLEYIPSIVELEIP